MLQMTDRWKIWTLFLMFFTSVITQEDDQVNIGTLTTQNEGITPLPVIEDGPELEILLEPSLGEKKNQAEEGDLENESDLKNDEVKEESIFDSDTEAPVVEESENVPSEESIITNIKTNSTNALESYVDERSGINPENLVIDEPKTETDEESILQVPESVIDEEMATEENEIVPSNKHLSHDADIEESINLDNTHEKAMTNSTENVEESINRDNVENELDEVSSAEKTQNDKLKSENATQGSEVDIDGAIMEPMTDEKSNVTQNPESVLDEGSIAEINNQEPVISNEENTTKALETLNKTEEVSMQKSEMDIDEDNATQPSEIEYEEERIIDESEIEETEAVIFEKRNMTDTESESKGNETSLLDDLGNELESEIIKLDESSTEMPENTFGRITLHAQEEDNLKVVSERKFYEAQFRRNFVWSLKISPTSPNIVYSFYKEPRDEPLDLTKKIYSATFNSEDGELVFTVRDLALQDFGNYRVEVQSNDAKGSATVLLFVKAPPVVYESYHALETKPGKNVTVSASIMALNYQIFNPSAKRNLTLRWIYRREDVCWGMKEAKLLRNFTESYSGTYEEEVSSTVTFEAEETGYILVIAKNDFGETCGSILIIEVEAQASAAQFGIIAAVVLAVALFAGIHIYRSSRKKKSAGFKLKEEEMQEFKNHNSPLV